MAKISESALKTAVAAYVDADKQANSTFTPTYDNVAGLLDKIGKSFTIDGLYQDQLPELEGEFLAAGKTTEEWFMDLTLFEAYSNLATEMAKENVPTVPSFEDVVYNYTLDRQKISTTEPFGNIERAFNTTEGAANFYTKIAERLQNSYDVCRYAAKKQLLGNAISKALAVKSTNTDVYKSVAIPTDAASAEDFIMAVKEAKEDASFAHEGGLGGAYIGATPSLRLYVLKGIMPTVAVKAVAGAINPKELDFDLDVKVVDDFGTVTGETDNKKAYAVLVDTRGIKLCNSYNVTRAVMKEEADAMKFVRHYEDTACISKYTFIRVFEG